MKRIVVFSFLAAALFIFAAGAFADEPEKKLDTSLKISGVIYGEYAHLLGYQPGSKWNEDIAEGSAYKGTSPNNNDTFRIQRVYLNFRKNISESISMRVTTDVEGSSSSAMVLYLKYAFVQYESTLFDFMKVNFQFGLIGTPVVGLLDDISDCRWIYQNLLDRGKNMLRGTEFDSSADFGVRLSLTFASMVTLTGAVVNGEGYKKSDEVGGNYDGKAYYTTLVINPIASLYINGFFRHEDTAANTGAAYGISSRTYYGFGAAWKSKLVTVGVHSFVLWKDDRSNVYRKRTTYMLTEAYLLANLGEVIPTLPVLFHSRYGYGLENGSDVANGGADFTTTMLAVGLGWQFNSNVRVLGYWENYNYTRSNRTEGTTIPDNANNFMVKCEVKF